MCFKKQSSGSTSVPAVTNATDTYLLGNSKVKGAVDNEQSSGMTKTAKTNSGVGIRKSVTTSRRTASSGLGL